MDSVLGELLQVVGQAEQGGHVDDYLSRVVLVPFDGVTVVSWELVVEVVVTFTEGDQSGDPVVSWGSSVVERLVTQVVGQRVDAESSLLDGGSSQDTSVHQTTPEVVPHVVAEHSGQDECGEDHDWDEVSVLPADNPIVHQVGDIGSSSVLWVWLQQHPAHVGVP